MLDDRFRLVSVEGGSHTVYPVHHNTCANDIADHYLVRGRLPTHDQYCAANAD